jgi:opacity protein-like surface antigen
MNNEAVLLGSSRDRLAHRRALWTAALTVVVSLFAAPPLEATDTGFYASIHAGPNFLPELEDGLDLGVGSAKLELEYNPGFNLGAAVGYQFPELAAGRFRLETEFEWQRHSLDDARLKDLNLPSFVGLQITSTSGHADILSLMGNVYFDFNTRGTIQPFVGLGAGVAWVDVVDLGGTVTANLPLIGDISVSADVDGGTESVAAAQAMAGISYAFAERWTVSAYYRGFVTAEADFTFNLPVVNEQAKFESNIASHGLRLELRYLF